MSRILPMQIPGGIGSLPHTVATDAVALVHGYLSEAPHWPQLPRLGGVEGFVQQFLAPLQVLGLVDQTEGKIFFATDQADWSQRVTEFYQRYLDAQNQSGEGLAFFALPTDRGQGFYHFLQEYRQSNRCTPYVKGQISGPVTVGLQTADVHGKAAYYDPQLRDLLVKNLGLQAGWQTRALAELGGIPIVVVDDPSIYCCGQSTHITLSKEQIKSDLQEIYQQIKAAGGVTGTHACAGADWSILLETDVDIISFDAYNYFETMLPYTALLNEFLLHGGILAWGIIPTSDNLHSESVTSLVHRLQTYVERLVDKGVTRELLLQRWMITPSCGTGLLTIEESQRIYQLTQQVAIALAG